MSDPGRALRVRRIVLLLVAVTLTGCWGPSGPERLPVLEGESVVDGAALTSETFAGDVLVVNAWATWCGPCRHEQPALLRVLERFADRGVSFLGIDHLDDRAAARRWIREDFDVPYPSLFDPAGRFASLLGYPGLPATYVVDREGTIRFRRYGPITERELVSALERVLATEAPADG